MTPYLRIEPVSYGAREKLWLAQSGHYLQRPLPGCLFAIGVYEAQPGLTGDLVSVGPLRGLCLVGRPTARALPQDGSVGEVTRMVLEPGLPHGTASAVLLRAAALARHRGMRELIAYHDRTRHTGCIYRKAGFRKDGVVSARRTGWGSRSGRPSAGDTPASKRRWRLVLAEELA